MNLFLGEIAALITSVSFSATSTFFTLAGRQVGSLVVNRIRLIIALILLIPTHWVLLGQPLPLNAGPERWFWLGLSGVIGLVLGDAFLFQAFIWIGPRISMLMMSLAPVLAAVAAWVFLDEVLSLGQIIGIFITLAGIAWVVLDQNGGNSETPLQKNYFRGILFALGGAMGQAMGLVTAKFGLSGDFSPVSANFIRMAAAALAIWGLTIFQGQARKTFQNLKPVPQVLWLILGGSITGPFLGVSFSLLAVQRANVGVASTLMALPPVILLPVGYYLFKERFSWQAVAGTFLAIIGVATLFLV
jgi:drug/metabolite transporter (DMT)-like permease